MTARARHTVARPSPGRGRSGCSMTASASSGGSTEAGALATEVLDGGECAPSGGSAEAGALCQNMAELQRFPDISFIFARLIQGQRSLLTMK